MSYEDTKEREAKAAELKKYIGDFYVAHGDGDTQARDAALKKVQTALFTGSSDSEPLKDISLAKRVSIQLQLTSPNLKSRDRVVRNTEKETLAEAMEFATIWLSRALSGKI